ncbi:MAG: hypothetical protein DRO05_04525 [Thermoproteota archaeon]|nr:MAG: hypothetical protein DRO05_04525 [Candidatus Korarchaeota archaeon]
MQDTLTSLEGLIIDIVASFPEGIGVNQLSRKLKGKVSKVKLIKEIKKLSDLGLLHITRDLRHKQRLLIKASEQVLQIFRVFSLNNFAKFERQEVEVISAKIVNLISCYLDWAEKLSDPYLISYLKYKVVSEFSGLISKIKEV